MSDLVEELREQARIRGLVWSGNAGYVIPIQTRAADEIERLQSSLEDSQSESERLTAEVERLRSALKQITLPEATWTRSDIDFIARRALDGEE